MRASSGLTLIEVLIAAVVLGVGLLGLLAAVPGLVRSGNQVALDLAVEEQAQSAWTALREGARRHTHTRWAGTPRRPETVFLLLPHPAAASTPAVDPASPAVLGERGCLVLPWGGDEVLVYPRAGDAAAIAAANAARQPADRSARTGGLGAEALFLLQPAPGGPGAGLGAELGLAIRIQRARLQGRAQDGLYRVALLFFRVPPGETDPARWTLLHQFAGELAAGPGQSTLPALAPHPEVRDARDWQDTVRWSQVPAGEGR